MLTNTINFMQKNIENVQTQFINCVQPKSEENFIDLVW